MSAEPLMDIWLSRMTVIGCLSPIINPAKPSMLFGDFLVLPLREMLVAAVLAYLRMTAISKFISLVSGGGKNV